MNAYQYFIKTGKKSTLETSCSDLATPPRYYTEISSHIARYTDQLTFPQLTAIGVGGLEGYLEREVPDEQLARVLAPSAHLRDALV